MSAIIHSKQEVFDGLRLEYSPAQAMEAKPNFKAKVTLCEQELAKAVTRTNQTQSACDDDHSMHRFLADESGKLVNEIAKLTEQMRDEYYALRGNFAIDEHIARKEKLTARARYIGGEIEWLVEVRTGANQINHRDAIVNRLESEHALLAARFRLNRITTIAALGPVMESEGVVGLMGGRTEQLREAVDSKYREVLLARAAAREARQTHQQRLNARVARGGIITSHQVNGAIPKY